MLQDVIWVIGLVAMKPVYWMLAVLGMVVSVAAEAQSFTVSFPKERSARPLDGRLLLLLSTDDSTAAVRFSSADSLEQYVAGSPLQKSAVSRSNALEEVFFLGLRLNRGVNLREVAGQFGPEVVEGARHTIAELVSDRLLHRDSDFVQLTPRGRLLSNEVFERFIAPSDVPVKA